MDNLHDLYLLQDLAHQHLPLLLPFLLTIRTFGRTWGVILAHRVTEMWKLLILDSLEIELSCYGNILLLHMLLETLCLQFSYCQNKIYASQTSLIA